MVCLVCKHTQMERGTTLLPIERGGAILLITDIPAKVCANCGEAYIEEETAREVQGIANEALAGEVSFTRAQAERTILVAQYH